MPPCPPLGDALKVIYSDGCEYAFCKVPKRYEIIHNNNIAITSLTGPQRTLLFSCQVVPDSFRPHRWQHTRLPCPSLSPRVCQSSCPLNQWCHPTISYSVTLFFCLHSFPASGSFPMSWQFVSGGQVLELQL